MPRSVKNAVKGRSLFRKTIRELLEMLNASIRYPTELFSSMESFLGLQQRVKKSYLPKRILLQEGQ